MKLVCAGLLLLDAALFAAPRIMAYHAEIHMNEGQGYSVDIAISTGADSWARPAHSLESQDGQRLSGFRASSDGQPAPWKLEEVGRLNWLVLNWPGREYRMHYDVQTRESGAARIPLAVPEIPTTGAAGSVTIAFYPASGEVIAGDMFPAFQRTVSGAFVAELSNVPNHVQLDTRRAGQAGFRERWLTPSILSDFVVITLLALGSIARALIQRKREV